MYILIGCYHFAVSISPKSLLVSIVVFFAFIGLVTHVQAADSYWVPWTPAGIPPAEWDTAEELLTKISDESGVTALEIDKWENSGWSAHVKGLPFNNFGIKSKEGYLLKVTKSDLNVNSTLVNSGEEKNTVYALQSGQNFVGFPSDYIQKYALGPKLSNLCNVISAYGGDVYSITTTDPYSDSDAANGFANTEYICGSSANNADLTSQRSYFVRMNKPFNFDVATGNDLYIYSWSPVGTISSDWNTASKLLAFLRSKGVMASEINHWENSAWSAHVYSLPFNDFKIESKSGYIIKIVGRDAVISSLLSGDYSEKNSVYALAAGNNLIGFPAKFITDFSLKNSKDVCANLKNRGMDPISVGYMTHPTSASNGTYFTEVACDSDESIAIEAGKAYFIKVKNGPLNWDVAPKEVSYWYSWGPSGKPNSDWDTAEELLQKLRTNNIDATEIDGWVDSGWSAHIAGLNVNNFSISAGRGYLIKAKTAGAKVGAVLSTYEKIDEEKIDLVPSRNFVSFTQAIVDRNKSLKTAEGICLDIQFQGGQVIEISLLNPNPSTDAQKWQTHTCGQAEANFDINAGIGVFVTAKTASTWRAGYTPATTGNSTTIGESDASSRSSSNVVVDSPSTLPIVVVEDTETVDALNNLKKVPAKNTTIESVVGSVLGAFGNEAPTQEVISRYTSILYAVLVVLLTGFWFTIYRYWSKINSLLLKNKIDLLGLKKKMLKQLRHLLESIGISL